MSKAPPLTILLVDDNEVIQAACCSHLEAEGYRVVTADDGHEALRKIDEIEPDLVLLDVMMPGLDGFQVLERLRAEHPPEELPVIMTTAKDQNPDVVRAFELGANDYVTKPLDYPVLSVRIRAQLRSKLQALEFDGAAKASAARALAIESGVVLDDKYLLESLISQGSYGIVYRARHVALDREVAVKLLGRDLRGGERRLRRFRREGISACRVDHRNAVTLLDSSVTAAGVPFLVMELLRGHTLEQEMQRKGRLAPRRCGEIVLPICDVLGEAHAVGIIHRDVKPSNVFLHQSRQGEIVKVLDFGIAQLVEDGDRQPDSGVVGTPIYMAPERFTGDPLDGRTDVYSVGVVLYEMLAGVLPFGSAGGNPIKVMLQQIHDEPKPLLDLCPELDPELAELVHQALAKDRRGRPTARRLGRRLAALLELEIPPSLLESSEGLSLEDGEDPQDGERGPGL